MNPPKLFYTLVVLFSVITLSGVLSSCTSNCGGPGSREINIQTYIRLLDSNNRFEEIRYTDFPTRFTVGDSYLGPSNFFWNLRISKTQTTMLIRTQQKGWDTIVYAMERKNIVYTEETECDDEGTQMEIVGPTIISHTFDSAYFMDVPLNYSDSYIDHVLYIQ
jgi:hypothetical protein